MLLFLKRSGKTEIEFIQPLQNKIEDQTPANTEEKIEQNGTEISFPMENSIKDLTEPRSQVEKLSTGFPEILPRTRSGSSNIVIMVALAIFLRHVFDY